MWLIFYLLTDTPTDDCFDMLKLPKVFWLAFFLCLLTKLSTFYFNRNSKPLVCVQSMEGLSARSVIINAACQFVILLYLFDNETSYVVLFSSVMVSGTYAARPCLYM